MNNKPNIESNFVEYILRNIEAMSDISTTKINNEISLLKNQRKFGVITENNKLKLYTQPSNCLQIISDDILTDHDKLLYAATISYWIANDMHKIGFSNQQNLDELTTTE